MTFPYVLLAAIGPLAVLAYGWAVARPASRLGTLSAWAGAVALALALSLFSLALL